MPHSQLLLGTSFPAAAGGSRPSLADLVLYAAVAPAACAFPVAQHDHFCNLLRWWVAGMGVEGSSGVAVVVAVHTFLHGSPLLRLSMQATACTSSIVQNAHIFCCRYDLLHHTVDAQRRFPAAVFVRPRYVAPPPPPPAEPKAAKGGNGDKAADKAAGDKAAAAPAASASSGKKGADKAAAPAAEAGGKPDKKVG